MSIFFGNLVPDQLNANQREFFEGIQAFNIPKELIQRISKQIQPHPDYSIRIVNFSDFQKIVITAIANGSCIHAESEPVIIFKQFETCPLEHKLKEANKNNIAFAIVNNGTYNNNTWNIIYIYIPN